MSNSETKNQFRFLISSAWMGALRAAIGLPYQHPLDCVKTVMQAQKKRIKVIDAVRMIYKSNGIAGFYKGYIPNTFRVMYKQIYRMPLMVYIPGLSEGKLKIFKDKNLNSSLSKSITGLTLGIIDVFLINPLERLKVWLMTNQNKIKLKVFFKQSKSITKQLFKGLQPSLFRQTFSWISFLLADEILKQRMRQYRKISTTEMLPYYDLILISVGVGVCNTLVIMPFDMAKTECQKQNGSNKWTLQILKEEFKNQGISKLYTGWRLRLVHYFVQSLLTVKLYDYLQTNYRKIKK